MKKLFLLLALVILGNTGISCSSSSDDEREKTQGNLSDLIIGRWKYQNATCNSGYTFNVDGTWSIGDFESDCNGDPCGYSYYGGTYSISGDILYSEGAPAEDVNLRGRVEISEEEFTIFNEDTGEPIFSFEIIPDC